MEKWVRGHPSPSSNPTVSRGLCLDDVQGPVLLLRMLPSLCLGLLVYMVTPVSGNTACGSTCLLNSMQPQVACLCHTDCHLWGVAPRILSSTNLPEKPKCPPHRSPYQGNCWQGCSCQSGTTGGHSDRDLRRVHLWPTEGMDPRGIEPPGPQGGGLKQNKDRPGNCYSIGNTYLPTVTCT